MLLEVCARLVSASQVGPLVSRVHSARVRGHAVCFARSGPWGSEGLQDLEMNLKAYPVMQLLSCYQGCWYMPRNHLDGGLCHSRIELLSAQLPCDRTESL